MLETVFVIVMTFFVVLMTLFFTSILFYSFNAILEKITGISITDILEYAVEAVKNGLKHYF